MKRISSRRSELSKNIRASLRINSPSSPAAVEDNSGRPHRDASPPGGPFQAPPGRRQPSVSDSSSAFEFDNSGPLPPLPFQLGRKPSFLVVTPAHLRRPGPYSPGFNVPMHFGEDLPRRLSHSSAEEYGVPRAATAAARRGNENRAPKPDPEITVAVRVRPVVAAGRAVPDSDRRCLLIERPGTVGDTAGREAVSTRQQQALTQLEKLEKKGGDGKSRGSAPEEADGWPRLLVTFPQYVQGAISIATTTRKFSGFDRVFDDAASQEDVYNGVVDGLLSDNGPGDNDMTLIACGYPKSGKSYTLFGSIFDSAPSAGQRRPPPVPVKGSSTKFPGRHPEIENLQPADGLLQRAVARLIASATGPVSMSYAQIMPTIDLPWSSQSISAGLFAGSERVVDLLTGEKRYETEGENFWSLLVKAPVSSLQDVNGRLRDGRRFWGHEGHAIVSFEFADRGGHARRLVLVDAAIADAQAAAAPHAGVSLPHLTSASGAIALDKLFTDARFVTRNMVLIATVSQEADSAAETMATLVSVGEVLAGRKAKGGLRRKSSPRDREGATRPSGDAAAASAKSVRSAAAAPSSSSSSLSSLGGGGGVASSDLHPLLREEREANAALSRDLDELADELAGAHRELARARLRERELMLDVSAAHGSLMALAQERDFEQAALLEATAAASESRGKWSSQVAECERLRRVIGGITAGWRVGPDGRLLARAATGSDAAGKSVADALATFASGHAQAHTAAEKLRRDLEERDRQLEKARRILSRERRTREKLKLKLGAAADVAGDAEDDDDPLSPAGERDVVVDELAAGFARLNRSASGRSLPSAPSRSLASSPSPSPSVLPAAAAAASANASPAGHLTSPALDVALGSSLLHLLDSQWTDEIARLEVPSRPKPDAAAAAAAEWEVVASRLDQQDHHRPAKNVLGVDLPADLASELENESEWEAMIAQFELDERRSTPSIRHRIHTANFAGSPY